MNSTLRILATSLGLLLVGMTGCVAPIAAPSAPAPQAPVASQPAPAAPNRVIPSPSYAYEQPVSEDEPPPPVNVSFVNQVVPMLKQHCASCHSPGGPGTFYHTFFNTEGEAIYE
jgi:hypothetical protein